MNRLASPVRQPVGGDPMNLVDPVCGAGSMRKGRGLSRPGGALTMAGSKRLTISLQVVAALSAALAAWLAWGYFRLELEVSFADDQTAIFEEMRLQAWQGD